MSTAFSHPQEDVIAKAIIVRGLGTDPSPWQAWVPGQGVDPPAGPSTQWPVFTGNESAFPDNCVTVYKDEDQIDAKIQLTGEIQTHWGIIVRVRGTAKNVAWAKAEAVRHDFNERLYQQQVTLDSTTYLVFAIPKVRISRPMLLAPNSTRWFVNLTCLAVIEAYPITEPIDYKTRWGVVSEWKLADLTDSVGFNTLINNGNVTFSTGKIGNAAYFTGNFGQSLDAPSTSSLQTGNIDFWVAGWVYFTNNSDARNVFNKIGEWELSYVFGTLSFQLGNPALTTVSVTPATGQWVFVMFYHDSVNDRIGISLDGGAFTTATTGGTAPTPNINSLVFDVEVGFAFDTRLDAVVWGKSPPLGIAALANEIRDTLYASGNGTESLF